MERIEPKVVVLSIVATIAVYVVCRLAGFIMGLDGAFVALFALLVVGHTGWAYGEEYGQRQAWLRRQWEASPAGIAERARQQAESDAERSRPL